MIDLFALGLLNPAFESLDAGKRRGARHERWAPQGLRS